MTRRTATRCATVAAIAGLSACASTLHPAASVSRDGVYTFSEHPSSVGTDFTGRIRITGDSIRVLAASPACTEQPPIPLESGQTQTFSCGGYVLSASRESTHWEFRYSTERTVQDVVQKCIAFKTTDGIQQCTATSTERRDRVIPVSGALRLVRVAAPPAVRSGDL